MVRPATAEPLRAAIAVSHLCIVAECRYRYTLLRYGWEQETAFFLPAATYTAIQILVAVTLYDFWLDDVLPLTCCPMFMPPRNLWDTLPKWWTMTDAHSMGNTRDSGSMEPLYWSPASPIFDIPLDEVKCLRSRVVWFGTATQISRQSHALPAQ